MNKSLIPNAITLTNLFCGCCAVTLILQGAFQTAFIFVALGGIADFLDGFVARILGVSSELGKQLDSLADMVSFGVVPAMIMFKLLLIYWYGDDMENSLPYLAFPAFLLAAFAAYRLGTFNLDTRQTDEFRGLNTPSATIFVLGIMMAYTHNEMQLASFILNPYFLYTCVFILGFLMVSDMRMFSFKAKNRAWKGNELRYIFIFVSILGIIILGYIGLSLAIVLYILLSLMAYSRKN